MRNGRVVVIWGVRQGVILGLSLLFSGSTSGIYKRRLRKVGGVWSSMLGGLHATLVIRYRHGARKGGILRRCTVTTIHRVMGMEPNIIR